MPDPVAVSDADPQLASLGDEGATAVSASDASSAPTDDANAHIHGQEHHDAFSIGDAILHHNMPWPAWEIFHGSPWILFDQGTYAAINYEDIKSHYHDEFEAAEPTGDLVAWAKELKDGSDFRYDVKQVPEEQLAKAMVVADNHAGITFPKALSWMNQQLFFGTAALLLLVLAVCGIWRRKPDQLKPAGRMQHFFESMTVYLRDEVVRPSISHGGEKWTAFLVAIFFMILAVNLFGLIPGTGTMSGNIGVTTAFAFVILFCMLFFGMKEQGPKFWINLVPIHFSWVMSPIWLLLLVIELMGLLIKPAALAIRLFANMFAGHTVLLVFFSLGYIIVAQDPASIGLGVGLKGFGWVLGLAFHAMEVLVAFIQAYVFTLLSALFIGMSIHPEH